MAAAERVGESQRHLGRAAVDSLPVALARRAKNARHRPRGAEGEHEPDGRPCHQRAARERAARAGDEQAPALSSAGVTALPPDHEHGVDELAGNPQDTRGPGGNGGSELGQTPDDANGRQERQHGRSAHACARSSRAASSPAAGGRHQGRSPRNR